MDPRELREATRAEHEATEALMPLTGPNLSREMYVRVLGVLESLVLGWERWAEEVAPPGTRELLSARRRSHLLQADLKALGAPPRGKPGGGSVPWDAVIPVKSAGQKSDAAFAAAFLGAMYVMEGSTLGGRFIARHVEEALELVPGEGDAYFRGHEEATGALWRELTARIAAVPEEFSPVMVEAARRTFQAFGEALRAGLAD